MNKSFTEILDSYKKWLGSQSKKALGLWESRNKEDAKAEALTWSFLRRRVDEIWHGEDVKKGGPDLGAKVKNRTFVTDCTAIRINTACQKTGLSATPTAGGGSYNPLVRAIIDKIKHKSGQLSSVVDPLVLAICTFHFKAGNVGINHLHIPKVLSALYNVEPNGTCSPITPEFSALLLLGFGSEPPKALGVLHPKPRFKFEPNWLPDVDICRLRKWPPGRDGAVEWVHGDPSIVFDPT